MDFTKIPEHQVTSVFAEERKERIRRGLWMGAIAVVLAAGATWFWQVRRKTQAAEQVTTAAAQVQLASLAAELEKKHRTLVALGEVSAEALSALEGAISAERQRQQLGRSSRRDELRHLEDMEAERDAWLARAALPRLSALEATAETQTEAGDAAAAAETLRQALALQKSINGSNAVARVKDYVRETRLTQALRAAEAVPLQREVRAMLARAETAVTAQQWTEARQAYVQARTAQMTLNQNYPGTRFADTPTLKRIEQELISLQAADVVNEVAAQTKRAETAAAAGNAEEASVAFAAAKEAQARVNSQFAKSRFSSAGKVDELDVKNQTAQATAVIAQVQAGAEAVAVALQQRNIVGASERVAATQLLADRVAREWPRSTGVAPSLKLRLSYLHLRRTELGAIQDEALDHLISLPGAGRRKMLATEVPQELYQRVMNTNPSRNAGRGLPVDSVSWLDAREFCERLGWVLGRRVRLPTEAEWLAAVGSTRTTEAWTRQSSGGHSREVGKSVANTTGFFDLSGNLSEWLDSTDEKSATAPVAGGSFLDRAENVAGLPVEALDKNERARQVGFRFVVETGG